MDARRPSEQRWRQIQTILDDVFELPTDQRLAGLQQACDGDPVLYQEVATLLKAEADAPAFLERPAVELAQSFLATATRHHHAQIPDYTGRRIGPYRLRDEIGRGGMGVVYRAERTGGTFDQQVAIKLLWNWQDREMRLDRFQREQQLLASLNHANIAQLYDGGLTPEGQPYIVMEYVQGDPINDYCDQHRLTIDARLKLTMQVIDALHYAHRNLVIHRDIKPSNILVTEDGQVKLLDFGIAKLLDDQAEPEGPTAIDLTHTGEQLMTPGFAAPEQLLGQNVTVATDVFQLGLVLYELLTGRLAFREHAGSFYELARNICERTPTRPSVVVNHQVDGNDSGSRPSSTKQSVVVKLSQARGLRLPQWRKKLSGDLDAIVLKALRNEPEKRYASMEALGADIQAYFEARAVSAHEKGARYRLGKFVRRNTLAVIAGVSIGVLLIAYAATVTVQANRIQSALERSRVEAHKAQQVSDFIIDIFKVSDPEVSGIETVTARELLDKSQERIHNRLEDAPEVKSQMSHVLGEIYYNLGSYKESALLLETALDTRRKLLSKQDPTLANTMTKLAITYRDTDRYDQARILFDEALAIHRSLGDDNAEHAEVLNSLALLLKNQRRYEEAESLYNDAIAMLRRVANNRDYSEVAAALNNLANLHRLRGHFSVAETNMREAVAMEGRVHGENHPDFALYLRNLAGILTDMERYGEAETLHLQALEIQNRVLGSVHPYVASTLRSLGVLAYRQGNVIAAEEHLRRALSIQRLGHGEDNAEVAYTLFRLGEVLQERGNYAEAHSIYEKMLRIDRGVYEPDNPRIGRDISKLASLAHAKGDFNLALKYYKQSLAILQPSTLAASVVNAGYARLLLELGQLTKAERVARSAIEILKSRLPSEHSVTVETQSTLGVILARSGHDEAALVLLEEAYRVLQHRSRPTNIFYEQTREALTQIKKTSSNGKR